MRRKYPPRPWNYHQALDRAEQLSITNPKVTYAVYWDVTGLSAHPFSWDVINAADLAHYGIKEHEIAITIENSQSTEWMSFSKRKRLDSRMNDPRLVIVVDEDGNVATAYLHHDIPFIWYTRVLRLDRMGDGSGAFELDEQFANELETNENYAKLYLTEGNQ